MVVSIELEASICFAGPDSLCTLVAFAVFLLGQPFENLGSLRSRDLLQ